MAGGVSEPAGTCGLIRPMLATAGPVPGGPGWAFEFRWDGVRSVAYVQPDGMRLLSGSDREIGASYPELDVLAARAGGRRVLLDGKIVALDAYGKPSFAQLQHRMNLQRPSAQVLRRVPVAYYVFDLLHLDGSGTLGLPYRQRRELLEELDLAGGPVVLPPYFLDTDGQAVLDTAARYGLSGVIAKRADSTYQPGRRSRSWVETALRHRQEVIIGGWVPGRRGRADAIGSLLVGVPTQRGLKYVGHVGTGLTDAMRRDLRDRLTDLEQRSSPFVDPVPHESARTAHWVAPELLGEVSYQQWSPHGRLAHPTWRGLRPRKHPASVQGPVVLHPAGDVTGGARREAADEPERAELDEAVRAARAEVRTLRTQISPHFLYNALNAIATFVRTDPPRARELLLDFADFTRYSLRGATDFSTLAEELDNIERYLTLEQARLGDRLHVNLQVAPDVMAVVVPFLAVQLLVVNAVRHGIEHKPHGGTVTICAVDAGADCLITVADDGAGLDPKRWRDNTDGPASSAADACLGTAEERLRAALGEDYGLEVDNVPGVGTTIRLRVPKLDSVPAHMTG